jgi:Uma2 family endonuclease
MISGNTALKTDPAEHFTYRDYKSWELKEGERYELIEGTAYAMSAPTDQHQAVSWELARQLGNYLVGKPCKARAAPYDVRLFYDEDETDDTVVQPDISVICDEAKRGPEGCRGAPDVVIEILSPSNMSDDYIRKFNLYLKAGVREYWIISPETRAVQVFILRDGVYAGKVYEGETPIPSEVLQGFSVDTKALFL